MAKKQTAQTNNSPIMGLLIIIIIILIIGIVGVGYMIMSGKKTTSNTSMTQEQSTSETTTTSESETNESTIETLEQAAAFALTKAGIENGATAKMDLVRFIYTPEYKSWIFYFETEKPSVQNSDKYDYTTYRVAVREDGQYDTTSTSNNNRSKDSMFDKKDIPTEVALSSIIDEAKQKVTAGGGTVGTITAGVYTGAPSDNWVIYVTAANASGMDDLAVKSVRFNEGNIFESIQDGKISIKEDGKFYDLIY